MDLKRKLGLEDVETKKRRIDEKRRRLSYLKSKHQEQYRPSTARMPRPKQTLKRLGVEAKKVSLAIQKQSKKMPSDKEMKNFLWGNGEQKKKS